jgi:hypothetical protein
MVGSKGAAVIWSQTWIALCKLSFDHIISGKAGSANSLAYFSLGMVTDSYVASNACSFPSRRR